MSLLKKAFKSGFEKEINKEAFWGSALKWGSGMLVNDLGLNMGGAYSVSGDLFGADFGATSPTNRPEEMANRMIKQRFGQTGQQEEQQFGSPQSFSMSDVTE